MALTQFSSKKVRLNLGVAAQAFYYKRDSKTGEISFLMANRSGKTFGGHTGPTASGGMKDKVRTLFGKRLEDDKDTLLREYLEETGVIAQHAPSRFSARLSFFKAKSAFDRQEHARRSMIGKIITGVFENFDTRFKLVHSQINNPHNPRWDATHDNFYGCELTESEFNSLARLLVNHQTGNDEVSSYQVYTAQDLLDRAEMGSIPPQGMMSLELENYAIVKLLHSLEQQTIFHSIGHSDRHIITLNDAAIKSGTPVISHGIRRIRKEKNGPYIAEVIEYNEQGKLVATGDKYRIRLTDIIHYEELIDDSKQDLYRKRHDQEPVLLLPHITTQPSKIFNRGAWVNVNPGDRIVVRFGDVVEVVPNSVVVRDYTFLDAPAKYQKRETAPTLSRKGAAPEPK